MHTWDLQILNRSPFSIGPLINFLISPRFERLLFSCFLFCCCRFIYVIILYGFFFFYVSVYVPCACTASRGQNRTLDLKLELTNQIPVLRKSRPLSHLSRPSNNGSFMKWIVKSYWIILYGWVSVLGGHNVGFLCCCCFVFCVLGAGKISCIEVLNFFMSGNSKRPFTSCLMSYIFLFLLK